MVRCILLLLLSFIGCILSIYVGLHITPVNTSEQYIHFELVIADGDPIHPDNTFDLIFTATDMGTTRFIELNTHCYDTLIGDEVASLTAPFENEVDQASVKNLRLIWIPKYKDTIRTVSCVGTISLRTPSVMTDGHRALMYHDARTKTNVVESRRFIVTKPLMELDDADLFAYCTDESCLIALFTLHLRDLSIPGSSLDMMMIGRGHFLSSTFALFALASVNSNVYPATITADGRTYSINSHFAANSYHSIYLPETALIMSPGQKTTYVSLNLHPINSKDPERSITKTIKVLSMREAASLAGFFTPIPSSKARGAYIALRAEFQTPPSMQDSITVFNHGLNVVGVRFLFEFPLNRQSAYLLTPRADGTFPELFPWPDENCDVITSRLLIVLNQTHPSMVYESESDRFIPSRDPVKIAQVGIKFRRAHGNYTIRAVADLDIFPLWSDSFSIPPPNRLAQPVVEGGSTGGYDSDDHHYDDRTDGNDDDNDDDMMDFLHQHSSSSSASPMDHFWFHIANTTSVTDQTNTLLHKLTEKASNYQYNEYLRLSGLANPSSQSSPSSPFHDVYNTIPIQHDDFPQPSQPPVIQPPSFGPRPFIASTGSLLHDEYQKYYADTHRITEQYAQYTSQIYRQYAQDASHLRSRSSWKRIPVGPLSLSPSSVIPSMNPSQNHPANSQDNHHSLFTTTRLSDDDDGDDTSSLSVRGAKPFTLEFFGISVFPAFLTITMDTLYLFFDPPLTDSTRCLINNVTFFPEVNMNRDKQLSIAFSKLNIPTSETITIICPTVYLFAKLPSANGEDIDDTDDGIGDDIDRLTHQAQSGKPSVSAITSSSYVGYLYVLSLSNRGRYSTIGTVMEFYSNSRGSRFWVSIGGIVLYVVLGVLISLSIAGILWYRRYKQKQQENFHHPTLSCPNDDFSVPLTRSHALNGDYSPTLSSMSHYSRLD